MDNFLSKLRSIAEKDRNTELPQSNGNQDGEPEQAVNGQHPTKLPHSSPPSKLQVMSKKLKLPDFVHRLPAIPKLSYKGRPIYRYKRLWLAIFGAAAVGGLAWEYQKLDKSLPSTADIPKFVRKGTLTIKAADGTILQQQGPATRQKLSINKIPLQLQEAFVASEDRRFYQHSGIDLQSIVRASIRNVLERDVVEGGSTITQQLARIVYLNREQTLERKIQEAMMAQKIDRELSKEQVLERYLNLVYLGSGAYGVADAAWVYFSKPVDKLTLSESATIAGLPPAPSVYSPLVDAQAAKTRRNIVLDRMVEAGYITQSEAEQAKSEPLVLKPATPKNFYSQFPYFTIYVQQQLPKYVSKEKLEEGGLTVETTLNPTWQKSADQIMLNAVKNYGPYEGFTQGALVAIDPKTGEIRSMVGGTDFKRSQFNRATQAQRQPGSSFKTLVYATAIAAGFSPYDGYMDATYMVDGYKPKNYSRKHYGWMSMRDALSRSNNVIAVKVLVDVGFDPTIKMAKDLGIKSKLIPAYSLALGSAEVNLLELTNAYGTLANQGRYIEAHGIRKIIDRQGKVIYDADFQPKQAIDKGSAAIITWMLRGVISGGTGQVAALDRPAAGKTGTSEDSRDLWFVGYIPQIVTGVWLGNDDNAPTWSASTTAASVWRDFMMAATKGMKTEKFPELPQLDGRKGTIKAKPVQPSRINSGFYDPESSDGSGSSGSSQGSYGGNGSYSGGGYSDGSQAAPEPSSEAPAPASEAAPEAQPPVNEAPAPAEPAPPPEVVPAEPPPPPAPAPPPN
ncbi:MAG: penicillin-binding protein 1A [Oscillatoriales cyanobacterium C42_A2020_001]|nr:penicillin-binding protein 1A [Leptolyngbyaceae cyanobacterium C42_A2020_001]